MCRGVHLMESESVTFDLPVNHSIALRLKQIDGLARSSHMCSSFSSQHVVGRIPAQWTLDSSLGFVEMHNTALQREFVVVVINQIVSKPSFPVLKEFWCPAHTEFL